MAAIGKWIEISQTGCALIQEAVRVVLTVNMEA